MYSGRADDRLDLASGCKLPARTTVGGLRLLAQDACGRPCERSRAPVAVLPAVPSWSL